MLTQVMIVLVVLLSLFFIISFGIIFYVQRKTEECWKQLRMQLLKHFSLIPSIVKFLKRSGFGETEMLRSLKDAYVLSKRPGGKKQLGEAYAHMQKALDRLAYIARNNDELQGNKSYNDLKVQILSSDEKLDFAVEFLNRWVEHYNTVISVFPLYIVANIFDYKAVKGFELKRT